MEDRRAQFIKWLVSAWDWVSDNGWIATEAKIAELLSHAEEPDYPLWPIARKWGVIGFGADAEALQRACGPYPDSPTPSDWEKAINFSPVIYLEESVWRHVHGSLGWANRDHLPNQTFWLWSNAGNVVRFVMRDKV